MKKIAILGTGYGARRAPVHDESFEIWSICGIWNAQTASGRKFDRIYEVHSAKTMTEMQIPADKAQWMSENITHINPTLQASFPNAAVIDFEAHLEKYGSYFTSSIAWLLAEAIEEKPDQIDIYGVTMSADEEYGHQKPACSYLIGWARANGIKVNVDRGAELMSAPYVYGYEDVPEIMKSLKDRKEQIGNEMRITEDKINDLKAQYHHMQGANEQIDWYEKNWWSGTKRQ